MVKKPLLLYEQSVLLAALSKLNSFAYLYSIIALHIIIVCNHTTLKTSLVCPMVPAKTAMHDLRYKFQILIDQSYMYILIYAIHLSTYL